MKFFYLTILFIFTITFSHAEKMPIKGILLDKKSGIPLAGVDIFVSKDVKQKTKTGLNGSFTINVDSIPVEITINYPGYKSVVYLVHNQNDNTISLETLFEDLQEVQINANLDKNTDIIARAIEKNAVSISNIVSAKAIELSPDFNVANVIQRVSGVTLERTSNGDAQYATLRGMDKRYNYTLVNGIKIPSPDNKNRFIPLDIFPSDMLARLEVTKSLTADMEGDGIGGAINMVMKDAPSIKAFNVNASTGYNSLFVERKFLSYKTDAINVKSPFELYSNLYAAKPRDFSNGLTNTKSSHPSPNLFFNSSFGNRIFKKKLGYIIGVSYQKSNRGGNATNYGSSISTSDASNLPVITGKSQRTFSDEQARLGVHGKLDYVISENLVQHICITLSIGILLTGTQRPDHWKPNISRKHRDLLHHKSRFFSIGIELFSFNESGSGRHIVTLSAHMLTTCNLILNFVRQSNYLIFLHSRQDLILYKQGLHSEAAISKRCAVQSF